MHLVFHSPHVHQLTSLSHAVTVTSLWCDHSVTAVTSHVIFSALYLSNNLKEKKRKRNINNDLAVLPSYDTLVPNKVPNVSAAKVW